MSGKESPLLEMHNVRVMRGDKVALDDFSLNIRANEHLAIIGPNGCGKSTLVKTIARDCYPVVREGSSMTIFGHDRWNIFELRPLLGIISNDLMAACTHDATGRDIALSGFFSSMRILPHHSIDPAQLAQAEAALAELGASHLADRPVREMSSGEARRMLIARALIHKPKALLFDEPTNSLDFRAHWALRETMRSLAQSGIGILLVTHDLSDIIPEIERVVLMSKGRVVADGPKDEILCSGHLSTLFGMNVEVARKDGYYHMW